MTDRRLGTLGLDGVPALDPLSYPGRPVPAPGLLRDGELLALLAPDNPDRHWRVGPRGPGLDAVLRESGLPGLDGRVPVLAIGSNASPGQLRHKLLAAGVSACVPMIPVRATGLAVGVCPHISAPGYVGAAPYAAPGRISAPVLCWFDPGQLAAVDATEPNYRRVRLPGTGFPVTVPGGAVLPETWLYVNRHGLLALDGRTPRPAGDQRALLRELLGASRQLMALLGPGPDTWVARAGADPRVRAEGGRIIAAEGWLLPREPLMTLD